MDISVTILPNDDFDYLGGASYNYFNFLLLIQFYLYLLAIYSFSSLISYNLLSDIIFISFIIYEGLNSE